MSEEGTKLGAYWWSFLALRSLFIRNLFLQAQQLNSIPTMTFCNVFGSMSALNVWNYAGAKTAWFTMTLHWSTLLCQCSSFCPLKTWLWSPPTLFAWLGPLWFLVLKN
jgi:hypothetical protein